MKYFFYKEKGRNIGVKWKISEKTGNGLIYNVITSGASSNSPLQVEFYRYILAKIDSKNHIKRFEFTDGKIFIDTIDFKNDDFYEYEDIIELDSELRKDTIFCHFITELLEKYNEVRDETISNIELERNRIDQLKKKRISASDLLCDYSITGMINANFDRESALEICEYLILNRTEILRSTHIKSRSFDKKIEVFSNLIVGLIVPFMFFWMIKLFNMDLMLHGLFLVYAGFPSVIVGIPALARKIICKNKNKIIDSLVAELEALYALSSDEKELELSDSKESVMDSFLEYIKRDAAYMAHHSEYDYTDIAQKFQILALEYVAAKKDEIHGGPFVDMYSFLNRLTELEVSMYSKNKSIGLKPCELLEIKKEELVDRLQCIGYDEKQTIEDRYLSFIFDQIKRISNNPYEGCENELLKLFKLAQDYVAGMIRSLEKTSSFDLDMASPGSTLIKGLTTVELEITTKLDNATKTESLEGDLAAIEEAIKENLQDLSLAGGDEEQQGFAI